MHQKIQCSLLKEAALVPKKIQKESVTLNNFRYEHSKELFLKYLITNKIGTKNLKT